MMTRAFSICRLAPLLTAGLVALSATSAAAATCRDFVGEAESRTQDAAKAKAEENAARSAQASLGSGISLQSVRGGYCRQDSSWGDGVTPGTNTNPDGYGTLDGNIRLNVVSDWKCTVTVRYCTIEINTPQPSIPGFTPPPTFKPKL